MTLTAILRFTLGAGVPLALLLVAPGGNALAPWTIPAADAAKTIGEPPFGRNRSATVRQRPSGSLLRERLPILRSRRPVRGPISSDFGARRSFWRARSHHGIDIKARHGTPVRAPLGGTVAFAGWRSGYGKTIIIDHGGEVRTLYGHLSRVAVRRGQRIESGAAIGLTGATGNASGPHLHYELLVNGQPVNPRGPVSKAAPPSGIGREQRGRRSP